MIQLFVKLIRFVSENYRAASKQLTLPRSSDKILLVNHNSGSNVQYLIFDTMALKQGKQSKCSDLSPHEKHHTPRTLELLFGSSTFFKN